MNDGGLKMAENDRMKFALNFCVHKENNAIFIIKRNWITFISKAVFWPLIRDDE